MAPNTKDDAQQRALKEVQVEAQRLIEAVQSAVKSDGDLLSVDERTKVQAAIVKLQAVAQADNRRHVTLAMDDLEAETKDFAAKRMNKSIRNAFTGKNINELENVAESAKSRREKA